MNQVVPGLEVEEEQRRKKFYEEHGKEEEADQNEKDGVPNHPSVSIMLLISKVTTMKKENPFG